MLLDTNVLLRYAAPTHTQHEVTYATIQSLFDRDQELYVSSQNLIEFWNVATRPSKQNGFGLSSVEALRQLQDIEKSFTPLPDHPDVFGEWRRLVVEKGVKGVKVHDARLVAVMKVYGISRILTFNINDFQRYASEGIVAVHPDDVM